MPAPHAPGTDKDRRFGFSRVSKGGLRVSRFHQDRCVRAGPSPGPADAVSDVHDSMTSSQWHVHRGVRSPGAPGSRHGTFQPIHKLKRVYFVHASARISRDFQNTRTNCAARSAPPV
jgi:hypothetical protein